jgi:uncharacterized protein (TIGR02246 family)
VEAWEAAAREAIRELAARYAHCADRGRFDELVALFAPDGVLAIAGREPLAGREAIRAFLADTAATRAGGGAPTRLFHHVASHSITLHDQTTASGAAYFLVVTASGPDHWGRYGDRYVARDGIWLFAERRVRVEGRTS